MVGICLDRLQLIAAFATDKEAKPKIIQTNLGNDDPNFTYNIDRGSLKNVRISIFKRLFINYETVNIGGAIDKRDYFNREAIKYTINDVPAQLIMNRQEFRKYFPHTRLFGLSS